MTEQAPAAKADDHPYTRMLHYRNALRVGRQLQHTYEKFVKEPLPSQVSKLVECLTT